jgi:hypothetical protein
MAYNGGRKKKRKINRRLAVKMAAAAMQSGSWRLPKKQYGENHGSHKGERHVAKTASRSMAHVAATELAAEKYRTSIMVKKPGGEK